jgi:hypothetical protein
MSTTTEAPSRATPWHLWVVGGIALIWNGFGGYDYWMSQTVGEAYYRSMGMNDAQIAVFKVMPIWVTCVWAIGVWGALLASLLLLARLRLAFPTFAVALAAFLMSVVYWYGLSGQAKVMGQMTLVMDVIIAASLIAFTLYARAMAKRGVLR